MYYAKSLLLMYVLIVYVPVQQDYKLMYVLIVFIITLLDIANHAMFEKHYRLGCKVVNSLCVVTDSCSKVVCAVCTINPSIVDFARQLDATYCGDKLNEVADKKEA